MDKKSGSGSGMNNQDHISMSLETIFWVKIVKFLKRIRDPGSGLEKIQIRDGKNSDPGWKKIRIRDKHPGSATLEKKTKTN
jgi:hypothetical protein